MPHLLNSTTWYSCLCSCFSSALSILLPYYLNHLVYAIYPNQTILYPVACSFLLTRGLKELKLRIHYVGDLGWPLPDFLASIHKCGDWCTSTCMVYMTLEIKPTGLWILGTTLPTELQPSHVVRIPGIFCRIGRWFRPEEEQLNG